MERSDAAHGADVQVVTPGDDQRQPQEAVLAASRPVLLCDTSDANDDEHAAHGHANVIEIPLGASVLQDGEGAATLVRARGDGEADVVFELCAHARSWSLLLLAGDDGQARVNGVAAAPITPLTCGDVLRLSTHATLHVSELRTFTVGPPPAELVARPCALCGVPLCADTRVHVCACGAARHLESEDNASGDEPLECLLVGACPDCDRPVPAGGLAYRPQP